MAFGMKQWLVTVAVGFALVAAWRLPPEARGIPGESFRTAERIRFQELESQVRVTQGVLFRTLWADSLTARVVAESEDGVAVLAPPGGEGVEDQRRRLAERVRDQIEARGGGEMVFGYVLQPHDHRREEGAVSVRSRTETYVGTRDGVDYCLQVRVNDGERILEVLGKRVVGIDTWSAPYENDLGPCQFYLAYGFPGEGIQDWLEGGAIEFGFEPPLTASIGEIADHGLLRRGPFGFDFLSRNDLAGTLDRCLAGFADACTEFLRNPAESSLVTPLQVEIVRRSPATGIGSAFSRGTWVQAHRYLLADLEVEYGEAAFRSFWTSTKDFDAAFQDAFATTPGEWMVQRIERLQGVDTPGPGVPRGASSASMLTIAAFLGMAYWRRRERQIPD